MDNKYDIFYQDVKRFLHQIGAVSVAEIEGTPIIEIENCGVEIPLAIKKYFEYCGEKFGKERLDFPVSPFKNFLKANSILKGDAYARSSMNEYFDHFLPFQRNDFRNGFDFCNKNEENPNNLLMEDYDVYDNSYQSFTNWVRAHLFLSISFKFYGTHNLSKDNIWDNMKIKEHELIDLSKVPWADYYINTFHTQEYQLKYRLSANTVHDQRQDFYKLIAIEEAEGDFLYSIDEFELKFIEYLKSKIEQ
jgi:hypothetical protein